MLGLVYPYEVLRRKALSLAGQTIVQPEFPLSKPWHALDLLFEVTVSTPGASTPATGPIADGLLSFIKAITLSSPKNERFFDNLPGRAAYLVSIFARERGVPRLDVVPAAPSAGNTSATFSCKIRIPFYDPDAYVPSDFILNTMRYSSMQLEITSGNIGDLYGTPNATIVNTATVTPVLIQEPVPLSNQPHNPTKKGVQNDLASKYLSWRILGLGDPTVVGFMDLPRSVDIAYLDLWAFYGVGGGVGQPFNGTPTDMRTKFTDFSLQADSDYPIKNILSAHLVTNWQEVIPTFSAQFTANAYWRWKFASDGRKQAALYSGDKAQLRMTWTLPASGGPAGGDQLCFMGKTWRNLQ